MASKSGVDASRPTAAASTLKLRQFRVLGKQTEEQLKDLEFATPVDAPRLTEVFLAAFSDDFNRRMFPPTADVREWASTNLLNGNGKASKSEVFLKVADADGAGELAGFAKWVLVRGPDAACADGRDGAHQEPDRWPESSDQNLCDSFFGTMQNHHRRIMGGKPHYYLEILGVHPSYQGRGIAGKLLNWGLAGADQEGVEVYLSSSPDGRRLYEKNGFRALDAFSPFPGYEQLNMVRPVQT